MYSFCASQCVSSYLTKRYSCHHIYHHMILSFYWAFVRWRSSWWRSKIIAQVLYHSFQFRSNGIFVPFRFRMRYRYFRFLLSTIPSNNRIRFDSCWIAYFSIEIPHRWDLVSAPIADWEFSRDYSQLNQIFTTHTHIYNGDPITIRWQD